jgi:hypothetical protein
MSSNITSSSTSTPLELSTSGAASLGSSASGGGGAPKFTALPAGSSSSARPTAIIQGALPAKQLASGIAQFNDRLKLVFEFSIIKPLEDQFKRLEAFIEMFMSPEILRFSPTELNPFSKRVFKFLPASVRPEFTAFFKNGTFHSSRRHGFCFPDLNAYSNILEFVKEIRSKGIVEVGFGSGMIGRAIMNLLEEEEEIGYHGHELESSRTKYPYNKECYLPKENYTIHSSKDDNQYLVEAAKNQQTLLISCFDSEEIHKNFGARDLLEIYINSCKAHNIKGSVILISDSETTDGRKFQKLLNTHFNDNGQEIEITGWNNMLQPNLRFYEMK